MSKLHNGLCAALFATTLVTPALAHSGHMHEAASGACSGPELKCATTVSATFGSDHVLWIAWSAGGRVSIAKSADLGKSFSAAVTLPPTALALDNGPDARPKIAIGPDHRLVVTFASRDEKYNGHAFIAESTDGGKTFSQPNPIAPHSPSQRFETAAIDADGHAFVAWIDKRNAAVAKEAGKTYAGAALAFAWDSGATGTLTEGKIAQDNMCECCRIAVAFAAPGRPAVLFRNIFPGGIRDHGVMTFASPTEPGPVERVSVDDAAIDACPHQGPSLSIGPDGTYHATWLALGSKLKGLYYARSTDGGKSFSTPMPLGDGKRQVSRPYVLSVGNAVYLAYKAFDGERTTIEVMNSSDQGKTWGKPWAAAGTNDESDHPQLVADEARAYLSWFTRRDGYRMLPLAPRS
jgi:hypothetical protein